MLVLGVSLWYLTRMIPSIGLFLAVFTAFFGSSEAWGGDLILDSNALKSLSEKSRTQPYRSKGGVFSREFLPYELGKVVTPYFLNPETGLASRRYRGDSCCFEVSYLSGMNRVKRIKCSGLVSDLRVPGYPGFRPVRVSELASDQEKSFTIFNEDLSFILNGYVHDEETIRMDQAILGLPDRSTFPRKLFSVTVQTRGSVSLDGKKGLHVSQRFELEIGKFGILDSRKKDVATSIVRKPGDLVFSDGAGKILIANDLLLPNALRNFMMETDPALAEVLGDLELRSRNEPVCYRDSSWGSGELGCHRIIDRIPTVRWVPFKLLLVDFLSRQTAVVE